jgi:hypothetical protein
VLRGTREATSTAAHTAPPRSGCDSTLCLARRNGMSSFAVGAQFTSVGLPRGLVEPAILRSTVDRDLPVMVEAVRAAIDRLP